MARRPDAVVSGSQVITIGATVTVAVDWEEVDGQAFTISSGTAVLYDSTDTIASASQSVTVTTGVHSKQRTQVTYSSVQTGGFTSGMHYIVWTLTLADGQTRIARSAAEVRAA